ncbi:hypothetical protein ABPG75_008612 [Micractinium tetrahymenae]
MPLTAGHMRCWRRAQEKRLRAAVTCTCTGLVAATCLGLLLDGYSKLGRNSLYQEAAASASALSKSTAAGPEAQQHGAGVLALPAAPWISADGSGGSWLPPAPAGSRLLEELGPEMQQAAISDPRLAGIVQQAEDVLRWWDQVSAEGRGASEAQQAQRRMLEVMREAEAWSRTAGPAWWVHTREALAASVGANVGRAVLVYPLHAAASSLGRQAVAAVCLLLLVWQLALAASLAKALLRSAVLARVAASGAAAATGAAQGARASAAAASSSAADAWWRQQEQQPEEMQACRRSPQLQPGLLARVRGLPVAVVCRAHQLARAYQSCEWTETAGAILLGVALADNQPVVGVLLFWKLHLGAPSRLDHVDLVAARVGAACIFAWWDEYVILIAVTMVFDTIEFHFFSGWPPVTYLLSLLTWRQLRLFLCICLAILHTSQWRCLMQPDPSAVLLVQAGSKPI